MNFKRNLKRASLFLLIGICLILIWHFVCFSKQTKVVKFIPSPTLVPSISQVSSSSKVIRVVDGDTIVIETGEKVRYIGMDTPEVYKKLDCFGNEATNKNKELVLGKTVRLEKDISGSDKYGRLLRYVYIDNEFINDELLKNGSAKVETVPPDIRYKQKFLESEEYAKENKLGLWGKCP